MSSSNDRTREWIDISIMRFWNGEIDDKRGLNEKSGD